MLQANIYLPISVNHCFYNYVYKFRLFIIMYRLTLFLVKLGAMYFHSFRLHVAVIQVDVFVFFVCDKIVTRCRVIEYLKYFLRSPARRIKTQ